MTEQTEETTAQAGAVPGRIQLEDLIEAVTRGVARALAAEDDVSGYLRLSGPLTPSSLTPRPVVAQPPIMIGIMLPPTTGPTYPGNPLDSKSVTTVG